jgi:D-alanine-D-alanine ligase
VLATALCLDKPRTKQVLAWHGIPTPAFQVVERADEPISADLRYPLIAKLAGEGSSMGLAADSIVDDERALRGAVARLLQTYQRRVLVEEFIAGREFTVGVLGNERLEVLPIVEVAFDEPRGINLFDPDDPIRVLARAVGSTLPSGGGHRSLCPAPIDDALTGRIGELARRAFHALDCRDWCRIDFRMDGAGKVYVLELNPIAGIDPGYLLPRAAAAAGMTYAMLVNRILDAGLQRARQRP